MINEVNNKPDVLTPVERQLEAYNAKKIIPFTAQFSDDIEVFRPPNPDSVIKGIKYFTDFYKTQRFNLDYLHAEVLQRTVVGNKVIDHERVSSEKGVTREVAVVYEIKGNKIAKVWFFSAE